MIRIKIETYHQLNIQKCHLNHNQKQAIQFLIDKFKLS